MATPSRPVRHGREKPAPQPLPARDPTPATTTTTDLPPSGTSDTKTPPSGAPLVIRVVYEPLSSIVQVEVQLAYEDPANMYSQTDTLRFTAADGAQERVFTLVPPDPTRALYRWSARVFTSTGVTAESAWITTSEPVVRIDRALQAALAG